MNPRYTRTRDMILDDAVPRLSSGGVALCHICQRSVYFAGGFVQLLQKHLERLALRTKPPGHCPRCSSTKLYFVRRDGRNRCGACRHEWSKNNGTAQERPKKPQAWYDEVTRLFREGHNPYRISKIMGAKNSKGVAFFVKRLLAFDKLEFPTPEQTK